VQPFPRRGDYQYRQDSESEQSSVKLARRQFLHAVAELEPKIFDSLDRIRINFPTTLPLLSNEDFEGSPNQTSNSKRQRCLAELKSWCRRWRLDEPWCRKYALDTLLAWSVHKKRSRGWQFVSDGALEPTFETQNIRWPQVGPWDPIRQTRQDFVREATAYANVAIQGYCDKIQNDVSAAGLETVRRRREPVHFYWLAGYQVLGWSCNRIADAEDRDSRRTVEHAVAALADEIVLKLRAPKDSDRSVPYLLIRELLKKVIASNS